MKYLLKFSCVVIVLLLMTYTTKAQSNFYPNFEDFVIKDTTIPINPELTCNSWDGSGFYPQGMYRTLNIMVNIIYDQTQDPCTVPNNIWPPATTEGINQNIPIYLADMMDHTYNPNNIHGCQTRLFAESSFGALIILGDFIVVNVKQSSITPSPNAGAPFGGYQLNNKVIDVINNSPGGFATIYGHNNFTDYDLNNDGKIDFCQIIYRNTTKLYGGLNSGQGYSSSDAPWTIPLNINGVLVHSGNNKVKNSTGTALGDGNITLNLKNLHIHEMGHNLFGGNNMHTSGGNHWLGAGTVTFLGLQGGYGLMGAYNSSLVCVNGYERWRMHWKHPSNNTGNYISATNNSGQIVNADVVKADGNKTFILRDFITYGDAIRIKLPYKDVGASNQYIWLENHKIGTNNKLDYMQWAIDGVNCRHLGTPGIYAYYQVGKDILSGTDNQVWPSNETDNLKMICAEGNWDFIYLPNENATCVGWGPHRTEKRNIQNPFNGYNDQQQHSFKLGTNYPDKINNSVDNDIDFTWKKYYNEINYTDSLPFLGDVRDAFTGNAEISISTNPAPFNAKTCYTTIHLGDINISSANVNNETIYLSGLKIQMIPLANGDYQVNISWNNYQVNNNQRWTGKIALNEKVILASNKTLHIDQSLSVNEVYRDANTNLFAKATQFTCYSGSEFTQQSNSVVNIDNKSEFIIKTGATYTINSGAQMHLLNNSNLIVEPCATLVIKGTGKLIAESGTNICIEEGANIVFENYNSFDLKPGYRACGIENIPVHELLHCPSTFTISNGSNITLPADNYYITQPIIVKNGGRLNLQSGNYFFGEKGQIIIEANGRLYVDGSNLTSLCNTMWEGIVVLGNSDQPPWYSKQGYVKLNGATIQNAKCGVKTVYAYGNPANDGLSGGLIHAINSNFINNITAMEFAPYSRVYNTYQIGAFNCNFTTNGALANPAYKPDAFIKLNGVQGIQIAGNKFEASNVQIDYASTKDQYTGILSTNSQYTVFPYKLNNVVVSTNRFIGLKRGIKALHTNSLNFVTVDGAEFNNTFMGMYLSGNSNSKITSNTFTIPQTLELINEPYGLYLDNSTGYHVEANSFTGLVKNGNYGIVVNNSGSVINEVYRNTFSNLSRGIYAQKNNRGDDEYNGLKLLCNTFSNTDVNVTVPQTNASPDGISIFQGLDDAPNNGGRNIFSHTQMDYSNWARHIVYFHIPNANHTPNPIEGNITLSSYNVNGDMCPSKLETGGGCGSETELKDKIADENTAIEQHENALNAWVDGGNTEMLQTDVALSAPYQALQLRDELLNKSPYLSDDVIIEAIDNEDALPAVMLKQVMVANPHAAKSENVMNELDNRNNPLPGYMKHEIEQGKNRISAKELLEAKLSAHLTNKAFAVNSLIRLYESDTTGNDSLLALLAAQNQPDYQYQLLWKHIAAGKTNQAQAIIAVLNNSSLSDAEQLELADLNDYFSLITSVINSGHDMQQLTPQEISAIAAIAANDNTRAGMYCKNVLLALDENYTYKEPIIKAQSGSNARINNSKQEQTDILNTKVAVYPNPANEYVIVDYSLEIDETELNIVIYDATGKVVYQAQYNEQQNQILIDIRSLSAGLFTCVCTSQGRTLKTEKINIIR